jgi:hypothetical protein
MLSGAQGALQARWSVLDSDWVAATAAIVVGVLGVVVFPRSRGASAWVAAMGLGWWVGFGVLVLGLGFRVNPPRSENWAGCVGLLAVLAIAHATRRDRVGLWLMGVGLLWGGVGFAVGDFLNMLGRADWGPIGASETLRGLNSWKWMEQLFGAIMGLGVGLGVRRVARAPLKAAVEDAPEGPLRLVAPLFLLVLVMWENFWKNLRTWRGDGRLNEGLFGLAAEWWIGVALVVLSAAVAWAVWKARRGTLPMAPASAFGRAQLLFLCLLWAPAVAALLQVMPGISSRGALFVHWSFWMTAGLASLIVVGLEGRTADVVHESLGADSLEWRPARSWLALILVAPLLVGMLTWLTLASHDGSLPNARTRFPTAGPTGSR